VGTKHLLKNWIFLNLNRPSIPNNDLIDIAIISEAITQPYLYTGREYDRATGLYYYRARYYDAETGAFILIHAAARVETATEVAQGAEFVGVGCGGYAIAEPANDNYKDEDQTEDDNPDSRMCKLMGTNDVLNFDKPNPGNIRCGYFCPRIARKGYMEFADRHGRKCPAEARETELDFGWGVSFQ
jgi:RHS repeat-associated protein